MRIAAISALALLFLSSGVSAQNMQPMPGHMGGPMMGGQPMPQKVDDNRQVVPLTEPEIALVMVQMRQMLASVQGVTDGLARGDMSAVVAAASKSGMAMMQGVPMQIRRKFPPAFAQMGMASHRAFDQIARDAGKSADQAAVLKLLSESTQNCVACHASYRFVPPKQ